MFSRFRAGDECTVIGREQRTDARHAASLNAMSGNVFDFDDTHLPTIIHPTAPVAPGTLSPTPKPKIKGTPEVGKKLTAKPGAWGPGAVTKTYKWFANGKAIPGATGKKLTLKAAQAGKKITVKVTGTKPGYTKVTRTSAATVKVTT